MIDKAEAAQRMRAMPEADREAAIAAAGSAVLDLRPRLAQARKQRALQEGYRRPRGGA